MRKLTVFKFLLLFGLVQMIIPGVAQMYPPKKPHINEPDELHFARLKDNTQFKNGVYPPEGISKTLSRKTTPDAMTSCLYTSNAQLAALTTEDLIAYLRSTSDYLCHSAILFNYEAAYSPQLFTHEKIQAVANEIGIIAEGFDGTYANGIYGLICYLHVAEYFDFYYNSTISIDPPTLATIAAATDSVCKNPHMFDLNAEASVILEEFLIVLDQPGIRALPGTIGFMKQVMTNMLIDDTWQTTPDIDWVLGYWRIYYIMFRGCVNNDYDYLNAVDADPSFVHLWGGVAADIEIMNNPSINYLYQDNAVLELFRVVTNPMFTDSVCPHLAEVCSVFPRLHVNWLWAVIGVNRAGCCLQYNLCENEDNLRQELKNFLFPNAFLYNDGNLIFQAKFQRDAADNLYYATRQTHAQCLRLAQTDQPVTGDTNTRLNCIVFESKAAYDDYAFYLYGISTNNGGMYIEQRAEFYTWDRPATYGLSLEELFRHEYNHYVQGRYLIPGCWGQTAFYQNNRLTWYEEGHADFLCASTDNEGVKLKQSTVNRIKADYPNWPTLKDVFNSYYGQAGAIYYPYGNMVWYNWYINDYEKIKAFNDLTRNDDVAGFDNLVNTLKNSAAEQAQWQSILTDVYNDVIPAWQISTDWMNDQYLTVGELTDIQNEYIAISGQSAIITTSDADSIIRRFRISGNIVGSGTATNNTDAAKSVNQALDNLLILLKNDPYINNFDYTVGYVTNVGYPGNIPTADYCIMGSLRDSTIDDNPVTNFISDKKIALTGSPINFESLSYGYIKGYSWSFPGGTPSGSLSENPVITYQTAGFCDVSLTVIGKTTSITNTKTVENYLKIYAPSANSYCAASHGYDYSWISHVKLNDMENTTDGFPPNGYSDFSSSKITELTPGFTYPISIDLSYTYSPSMGIGVWIDLNNNGSFSDPDEQLLLAHPTMLTQLSGASITIPANAANGVTRMRIRATYNGYSISPCGYDGYMGEVEDYSIVIGPPTYCTVNGTVTGNVCYNATQTISVAGNGTTCFIDPGESVTMIAGQKIFYLPGTKVSSGGYMWGYIAPTGPFCLPPAMTATAAIITEMPGRVDKPPYKIYPNPTEGKFILELSEDFLVDKVVIEIYGMAGKVLLKDEWSGKRMREFSLARMPAGIYFIRMISEKESVVAKIIKQ